MLPVRPPIVHYGYIAHYDRKRYELYATSTVEAQRKAAQHFGCARKPWLVSVVLAEKDNEPVIHTPDM